MELNWTPGLGYKPNENKTLNSEHTSDIGFKVAPPRSRPAKDLVSVTNRVKDLPNTQSKQDLEPRKK